MQTEHTVLLLSQDPDLISQTESALSEADDYRLILVEDERDASARLEALSVDLLICDADYIDQTDSSVLATGRISHPNTVRMLIGQVDQADACSAIVRGADVYLYAFKPLTRDALHLLVKRALEMRELSRRHRLLSRELKVSMDDELFSPEQEYSVKGGWSQFEKLVYASAQMAELCDESKRAAQTELPVLIQGETGTGKELLARAIHFNSARLNSPMLVQNCGGVSDEMLHSELFGHVRGAFTGAISDRLGLFRAADGGTVFLDEISEITPTFQVSLLRFLQEGEVKPLGSDRVSHANVRIVAASNRPLAELVELGKFRRDLYYRLKGFELHIPPLRERREDIGALAQFFVEKYAGVVGRRVIGITKDALGKLEAYHYPGNVRELETEIRRMVAIAEQGGYLSTRHLSPVFDQVVAESEAQVAVTAEGSTLKEMVEALEKQVVADTLTRHRWNQSKAAEALGLSRVGLANKIKRYGLQDA